MVFAIRSMGVDDLDATHATWSQLARNLSCPAKEALSIRHLGLGCAQGGLQKAGRKCPTECPTEKVVSPLQSHCKIAAAKGLQGMAQATGTCKLSCAITCAFYTSLVIIPARILSYSSIAASACSSL